MLTIKDTHISIGRFAGGVLALLLFFGIATSVSGQAVSELQNGDKQSALKKAELSPRQPIVSVYKDVKIGTTADEVRELLGKAEIDDKDGFFYEMDSEMVQIRLDQDQKVRLIA